jgi:hypothetical protein
MPWILTSLPPSAVTSLSPSSFNAGGGLLSEKLAAAGSTKTPTATSQYPYRVEYYGTNTLLFFFSSFLLQDAAARHA